MLKNNEPYRYAVPLSTETKLSRLRVQATGEKRTSGPTKGAPRSQNYGSHQHTRAIPSINRLYEQEGLPPIAPLPAGEMRMLRDAKLLPYVEKIQSEQRVVKNHKPKNDPGAVKKSKAPKTTNHAQDAEQKNAAGSQKNVVSRLTRS